MRKKTCDRSNTITVGVASTVVLIELYWMPEDVEHGGVLPAISKMHLEERGDLL